MPEYEIEAKCICGRKLFIKFLSPITIEQTSTMEIRGENSDGFNKKKI